LRTRPVFRATLVWLLLAALAVANGALRDTLLPPFFGPSIALPLSGVTLSLLILAATRLCFSFLQAGHPGACRRIGLQWLSMTLAFEYLLGHFVMGKDWPTLLQTLDVAHGNLFVLVLLVTLAAPCLVSRWLRRV